MKKVWWILVFILVVIIFSAIVWYYYYYTPVNEWTSEQCISSGGTVVVDRGTYCKDNPDMIYWADVISNSSEKLICCG